MDIPSRLESACALTATAFCLLITRLRFFLCAWCRGSEKMPDHALKFRVFCWVRFFHFWSLWHNPSMACVWVLWESAMGHLKTILCFAIIAAFTQAIGAASAANRSNNYLLSLTPEARATMLEQTVGEGCVGRATFYMGIGESGIGKDKAFWSVRCSNGQAFAVQVNPDGTTNVLECAVLEAVHGGTCFKKFP